MRGDAGKQAGLRSRTMLAACVAAVIAAGCTPGSGAGSGDDPTTGAATASSTGPASADGPGPAPGAGTTPSSSSTSPPSATGRSSAAPGSPLPTVDYRTSSRTMETYVVDASLPVVRGLAPEVGAAVEQHVTTWFADQLDRFAREDADFQVLDADEGFPPGRLQIRSVAGEPSSSLLSLAFTVTSMHQGMAHPWTVVEAVTFDLATGRPVSLPDLFATGSDVHGTIADEVAPRLVAVLDPAGEGWAAAGVREGAAPDAESLRRFVVDRAGLTLHFDQYQVAPGAAGVLSVTLEWDGLLELLPPSPLLDRALEGMT